jgi:hypothetical protein
MSPAEMERLPMFRTLIPDPDNAGVGKTRNLGCAVAQLLFLPVFLENP